jgi:hypothetical protein
MMGGLQMIETRLWAGAAAARASKAQGFTYITKVYAETYR